MSENISCVFCDILAGKIPETVLEFDNENIVIFKDIKPASDFHFLAVSKKHISDVRNLNLSDKELIDEMKLELENMMRNKNVDLTDVSYGFHLPPFISVKHLHMHAIAPVSKMRFFSRIIFARQNIWYCSPEYVIERLKPVAESD